MNPDALPSVAAGRALQPDLAELAAAFGLSAVSGAVSLDAALCAALPAGKGVQSALLVRQAIAADLLRDGGKDWQHYYSERWLLPQFRNEVEEWVKSGSLRSPIVPVALAASADAFGAAVVTLHSRDAARLVTPSRSGVDCVLWIAVDDLVSGALFAVLRPCAGPASGILQLALVRLQLGCTTIVNEVPSPDETDRDGDWTMEAESSAAAAAPAKVRRCFLTSAVNSLRRVYRAAKAARASWPCAALSRPPRTLRRRRSPLRAC